VGETKKKSNPGILDWVADFFVSPIKNAVASVVGQLVKEVTKGDYDALITRYEKVVNSLLAEAEKTRPKFSPMTPEEAKAYADWVGTQAGSWWGSLMKESTLAEASSLGFIDVPAQGYWRRPLAESWVSRGLAKEMAEWNIGIYPVLTRYWLKQYTPLLPPYQDMIGVYVREGYLEDHQVELPSEFAGYMKEQGYSDFWTKRLWGKHWVLPGVELLYDMYHKKIIDYETLALMLKFHDFLPEWRDRLIRNAYELIPRVDLRRAYMYGVDGYEDLVEPYEKLGYSPEDAQTMDQIAKRFALEAHYSRLLTVARAAYRKGQLPGPEFQAIMEGIHVPPAAQDLILQAETLARLTAVKDFGEEPYMPSRSDMRWMAEWGQISAEELKDLAEADGIDPAWSPRVTEAWLLNQQRDELAKVRAVYERRLREGFMSKADFGKALGSLHYAGHVVDALERWAEEELDLQERLEEAKEYEALAKDGILTVTEYGQALRKLGMTEERITRSQKHIERLLAIKAAKEAAKTKG